MNDEILTVDVNLNELLRILNNRFNKSELQSLCFELHINYEDLPGPGKTDKARELIAFLKRRHRIAELIKVGEQLRPDVLWRGITQTNEYKRKFITAHVSITFSPLPLDRGFIGREEELILIADKLNDFPVVLVEGISGIGKTSLIAKYLSQRSASIKNSLFWLECQEGTDINDIFGAFFDYARRNDDQDIEVAVQGDRPVNDRIHSLISVLDSRASFLCLDGFENANDESVSRLVVEFIEHCRYAKLVICTRERPKSFFSFLVDLSEIVLGGFDDYVAITMLERLKIGDDKREMRKLIAKKTEGHPFAIKLCASLIRNYGLSVEELLNDAPEFGKSLEEHWLSKIYKKLSKKERDLLERISVYIEPVEKEGIQKVSASSNWTEDFFSLQDKFLLNQINNDRFTMHSLIREFCYHKLDERSLAPDIAQLAADYYLGKYSLDDYNRELSQDEVSNKLKAHHYLIIAGNFNLAARVVHNIQHILMTWARYSQLLTLLEISLDTAPGYEKILWFRYYQARIFYIQGKLEDSRNIFEQLSAASDQSVAAESIQMLANALLAQRKTDEVIALFEQNLPLFRHRAKSQQRMFDKIARVYIEKGEIDQAIQIYNQILHWHQAEEDRLGSAITLRQLAIIYSSKSNFANAHSLLNLAQELAIDVDDKRLIGWIESTRGEVYEREGSLSLAIECYEKSLAKSIKIDNRIEIIGLSNILCKIYKHQGNDERVSYLSQLMEQTKV